MRVTVLGKSPAWQDAGGACSGYLVEEDGAAIMLDCGNGSFGKLRQRFDYRAIDAVVISHLHADHCIDLIPFSYGLTLAPASGSRPRPRLLLPPGGGAKLREITGAFGDAGLLEAAFEVEEYEDGAEVPLGSVRAGFAHVPHFTPTHAVTLASRGGRRFAFSADCRPGDELVAAARGADLLLAEATLGGAERDDDASHMTAREAGEAARQAGARRLVLTHLSDELDLERARAEAERGFGGPVEIAAEGAAYEV